MLKELYQEIDEEYKQVTQDCDDDLQAFKDVLAAIARITAKKMDIELRINRMQAYYHVLEKYDGVVATPADTKLEEL